MSIFQLRCYGVFLAILFSWATHAEAGTPVYRCDAPNGVVVFSDQPCEGGTRQPFEQNPAPAPGTRLVDTDKLPKVGGAGPQPRRTPRKLSRSSKPDQSWCRGKRGQLERIQDELRAGYSPSRGEDLRRQRRRIEGEIRERCR